MLNLPEKPESQDPQITGCWELSGQWWVMRAFTLPLRPRPMPEDLGFRNPTQNNTPSAPRVQSGGPLRTWTSECPHFTSAALLATSTGSKPSVGSVNMEKSHLWVTMKLPLLETIPGAMMREKVICCGESKIKMTSMITHIHEYIYSYSFPIMQIGEARIKMCAGRRLEFCFKKRLLHCRGKSTFTIEL